MLSLMRSGYGSTMGWIPPSLDTPSSENAADCEARRCSPCWCYWPSQTALPQLTCAHGAVGIERDPGWSQQQQAFAYSLRAKGEGKAFKQGWQGASAAELMVECWRYSLGWLLSTTGPWPISGYFVEVQVRGAVGLGVCWRGGGRERNPVPDLPDPGSEPRATGPLHSTLVLLLHQQTGLNRTDLA